MDQSRNEFHDNTWLLLGKTHRKRRTLVRSYFTIKFPAFLAVNIIFSKANLLLRNRSIL